MPDAIGRSLDVLALGPGDPLGGRLASHVVTGAGLGPMAPVHLAVVRRADGWIESRWVARGRESFDWGGPAPAPTDFSWRFAASEGGALALRVSATALLLSPDAQVAAWGGLLPAGEVRVEAIGEGPQAGRTSRAAWLAAA